MNIKDRLQQSTTKIFPRATVAIEIPSNPLFGDYALNIRGWDFAPQEKILNKIKEKIKNEAVIAEVQLKNGFVNFYLAEDYLLNNLNEIIKNKDDYGKNNLGKDKTVVIDYSSPNIAKPFSIGHLRSTIIGQAVYNFHQVLGWKTIGDNHLGDWGTQYGKLLYAISEWGKLEKIAKNPIPELLKLYVKFHKEAEKNPDLEVEGRKWFQRLEAGDEEAKILWEQCAAWSLEYFNKIYSTLGVKIDHTIGESFYSDKMKAIIEELERKGITKESEGAKAIFFPQDKLPPVIIVKSDGTTTYLTRDLAAIKYRLEKWKPDKIIYHVSSEQSLYFKQLFEIVKMLDWNPKLELIHADHGLSRLKDGKFSTRKGNIIILEEVIEEAKKRVEKMIEEKRMGAVPVRGQPPSSDELIETIAISAIKYNDLRQNRRKDIIFDWDKVLNLDGNSGPYLQYTYARIMGLFREAEKKGIESGITNHESGNNKIIVRARPMQHRLSRELLRHLSYFPETIIKAAETQMPHFLCEYLYQLASLYNGYYNNNRIIVDSDEDGTGFRLALSSAVAQVLKNGLGLLGIKTVERM